MKYLYRIKLLGLKFTFDQDKPIASNNENVLQPRRPEKIF